MYQALKSLGIDTQLVIYPNSFHGITCRAIGWIDWNGTSSGTTDTSSPWHSDTG